MLLIPAITADRVRRLRSGAVLHIEGVPGAPPLLFLHGVGGGAWSWNPQRAAFADSHHLFVWEARGHGDAAPVHDAGLADYYEDALEAIEEVYDMAGPPVIVGHSMGGLLAIAAAADRPAKVRGLFLVDPVYSDGSTDSYGHMPPSMGRVVRWFFEPALRSFQKNGTLSKWISRRIFEMAFMDRERMENAWIDQQRQVPIEYQRMLRESFESPSNFPLRDFAAEIAAPTLVLECSRSDKDTDERFPRFTEKLRERLGERFYSELIRGGHYLQLDRPSEVNRLLRRFLDRISAL